MKKEKHTSERIKDAADALRIIIILVGLLTIGSVIIWFTNTKNYYLLISSIVFIISIILLHACYCFLYGFSDMLDNSNKIANEIHLITDNKIQSPDSVMEHINPNN